MRRFPRLISATDRHHSDAYLFSRPGTLCFRSTYCQEYNPKVLNNDWYEFRMSLPLDYDSRELGCRNSNQSSYRNFWFGDPNAPLPKSTTHAMMEESLDWWGKKKLVRLPYLCPDNVEKKVVTEKASPAPEKLPRLKPTVQMREKPQIPESVTMSDYKFLPHSETQIETVVPQAPDPQWMRYPVHTQCRDLDGHKQKGIYTCHAESCKYSHYRNRPEDRSAEPVLHNPHFNKPTYD